VLAGVSMRQVADVSPITGRDGACSQLVGCWRIFFPLLIWGRLVISGTF
jgi:hypothetical protein